MILCDTDGNPFTGRISFVPQTEDGTVEVPITISTASIIEASLYNELYYGPDGRSIEQIVMTVTKDIVCYEYLYSASEVLIGGHTDITDEGQTINITPPDIGTTFVDRVTEEHQTVAGRIVQVRDTVSYTNLHVGETYTLTCHLYDQTTGKRLTYSNGEPVVATKTFVAPAASGSVDVIFTIDTSDLLVNIFRYEERTLVAFEYLRTEEGILIGGHTEIDDLPQSVTPEIPVIGTTIVDDQTGTHDGRLGSAVPFTDTVSYTNLNPGETYVMRGRIVNRQNPSIVYTTAEQEFVPESRNGTVDVHFIVDTSWVCNGSYDADIVCFEQLWQLDTENTGVGEVMLAKHEDVTDEGQTIHLHPEIGTQMIDPVTRSQYGLIGEDVEFIDTVSYHNLHIGEEYTVSGIIMDKQTGEPVLDRNGQPFTASTTFTPTTSDGTVDVVYHVNTLYIISQIGQTINGVEITAPRAIVSFETITSESGFEFEIHADIEDEGQTITLGDICSGAADLQTSVSTLAAGLTTVRDIVHYRGLGPVEYTIRGSLHLIDYDENGNPVDGGLIHARSGEVTELEYTFTPETHEGDVVFDYKLDTTRYAGRDIIVFEELWFNGICIVTHENYADVNGGYGMNNYDQTVFVPEVHTSAFSADTTPGAMGRTVLPLTENARIVDNVWWSNVEIGDRYYVQGQLWACWTDENGNLHSRAIPEDEGGLVTSAPFTAESRSGYAEVVFTIDSTRLAGMHYDYLIVTEKLFHANSGICVANHCDLSDVQQTVYMPDLHTTAYTETGSTLPEGAGLITVTDRVYYENLVPGTSYTIVGNLQYAVTDANGNVIESGPLVQNGQEVKAEITFTPTESSGYVELTFTVDAGDIVARHYNKIIAFEEMYTAPGVLVSIHADINDEDQTLTVSDLRSSAHGVDGSRSVAASNEVTVIDTVFYEGLTAGCEYRMETDLMNLATGESDAHCSTVFSPVCSDGSIDISLCFDGSGYTGEKLVIFERVYDNRTGVLIKSHEDWNEWSQTITFVPQTGNDYDPSYRNAALVILALCFSMAGAVVFIPGKRKR